MRSASLPLGGGEPAVWGECAISHWTFFSGFPGQAVLRAGQWHRQVDLWSRTPAASSPALAFHAQRRPFPLPHRVEPASLGAAAADTSGCWRWRQRLLRRLLRCRLPQEIGEVFQDCFSAIHGCIEHHASWALRAMGPQKRRDPWHGPEVRATLQQSGRDCGGACRRDGRAVSEDARGRHYTAAREGRNLPAKHSVRQRGPDGGAHGEDRSSTRKIQCGVPQVPSGGHGCQDSDTDRAGHAAALPCYRIRPGS
mmetsp:Transcript_72990/g.171206  ORF Transcript_72990/g.171206 Transcript_72990/m.171206 type:complete len:253 (-) Transcript_72990:253-1011(-)